METPIEEIEAGEPARGVPKGVRKFADRNNSLEVHPSTNSLSTSSETIVTTEPDTDLSGQAPSAARHPAQDWSAFVDSTSWRFVDQLFEELKQFRKTRDDWLRSLEQREEKRVRAGGSVGGRVGCVAVWLDDSGSTVVDQSFDVEAKAEENEETPQALVETFRACQTAESRSEVRNIARKKGKTFYAHFQQQIQERKKVKDVKQPAEAKTSHKAPTKTPSKSF